MSQKLPPNNPQQFRLSDNDKRLETITLTLFGRIAGDVLACPLPKVRPFVSYVLDYERVLVGVQLSGSFLMGSSADDGVISVGKNFGADSQSLNETGNFFVHLPVARGVSYNGSQSVGFDDGLRLSAGSSLAIFAASEANAANFITATAVFFFK